MRIRVGRERVRRISNGSWLVYQIETEKEAR